MLIFYFVPSGMNEINFAYNKKKLKDLIQVSNQLHVQLELLVNTQIIHLKNSNNLFVGS